MWVIATEMLGKAIWRHRIQPFCGLGYAPDPAGGAYKPPNWWEGVASIDSV